MAQLLVLSVDEAFPLREVAPWSEGHPLTAGLVAQWLRIDKREPFVIRDGFDPKSQKFSRGKTGENPAVKFEIV